MALNTFNIELSTLETAALAGNFDAVKRLVAMSDKAPQISGATLFKLLDGTATTLTSFDVRKNADIAAYLMENGEWNSYELEKAFQSAGTTKSFVQWILEQKKSFHNISVIETLIRDAYIVDELRAAVKANDLETFTLKFKHYSQKPSFAAKILDNLPVKTNNALRRKLRKNGIEGLSQYLSPLQSDNMSLLLSNLIFFVEVTNVAMLAKLVEHGVDLKLFEQHVGFPIEQWCKDNNCEDLLQISDVKERIETHQISRLFITQSASFTPEQESMVLGYVEKHGVTALQRAFDGSAAKHNDNQLYNFLAMGNVPKILSLPGVLPTDIKAKSLNTLIVDCAKLGLTDCVDILIAHAKRYCPSALRFSGLDIGALQTMNKGMAQKLQHAFEPPMPAQSLMWRGLSYIMNTVVNQEGLDDLVDESIPEDAQFTLNYKLML